MYVHRESDWLEFEIAISVTGGPVENSIEIHIIVTKFANPAPAHVCYRPQLVNAVQTELIYIFVPFYINRTGWPERSVREKETGF